MEKPREWSIRTKSTRNVGVRLPLLMYRDVAQLAALRGWTVTELIKRALVNYLKMQGYDY